MRFEKVDVNLPITRQIGGRTLTFIATVRDAASKSLAQIQEEIIEHQECPAEKSFAIERVLKFDKLPFWLASWLHPVGWPGARRCTSRMSAPAA